MDNGFSIEVNRTLSTVFLVTKHSKEMPSSYKDDFAAGRLQQSFAETATRNTASKLVRFGFTASHLWFLSWEKNVHSSKVKSDLIPLAKNI